jgi:hypothetical protein
MTVRAQTLAALASAAVLGGCGSAAHVATHAAEPAAAPTPAATTTAATPTMTTTSTAKTTTHCSSLNACTNGVHDKSCGQDLLATPVTSCGFAQAVEQAYLAHPGPYIRATSAVTGKTYVMHCVPAGGSVDCSGGVGAFVSFPKYATGVGGAGSPTGQLTASNGAPWRCPPGDRLHQGSYLQCYAGSTPDTTGPYVLPGSSGCPPGTNETYSTIVNNTICEISYN